MRHVLIGGVWSVAGQTLFRQDVANDDLTDDQDLVHLALWVSVSETKLLQVPSILSYTHGAWAGHNLSVVCRIF